MSANLQQRPVTTETSPERSHPPDAGRHAIIQRVLQNKINRRTAYVAVFEEHGLTPADVVVGQAECVAQRDQHVASARMKNPARDLRASDVRMRQGVGEKFSGVLRGE